MAHDATLVEFCHLVKGPDGIPGAVFEWKPHVSAWPRRTRDAEADVGFYRLPGMRDTYVDAVISYADPATYAGCESTPGHVAELKKRDKHRDHPVFDTHLRRRVPFDFITLSFERHGWWAKETVSFTKKLASDRALLHEKVVEHLGSRGAVGSDRLHLGPGPAGVGAARGAAARDGSRRRRHRAGAVADRVSEHSTGSPAYSGAGVRGFFSAFRLAFQ